MFLLDHYAFVPERINCAAPGLGLWYLEKEPAGRYEEIESNALFGISFVPAEPGYLH